MLPKYYSSTKYTTCCSLLPVTSHSVLQRERKKGTTMIGKLKMETLTTFSIESLVTLLIHPET